MAKIVKILLGMICVAALGAAFVFHRSAQVAVTHPVRGPAVDAVYATGTVEPSVMLPVAPRSPGRLVALLADEGMAVQKNQVLAQLEDEDLQKTVAENQAQVDLAQKEYDRKAALAANHAESKEALDRAKADLDVAKASAERAKVTLGYMKLTAPEDGLIIRREGEVGELIPVNQPVFWMSCCDGLRVSTEVDEEDIAKVKPGQKAVIQADAFPGEVFEGKVQSITPKGDPVSRSYRVRVGLPLDTKLLIGMTAETNIVIREEKNALLLPASAVNGGTVFVIRNDAAERQKVEAGAHTAEAVEIRSGLSESDLVVLDAAKDIETGKKTATVLKQWKAP